MEVSNEGASYDLWGTFVNQLLRSGFAGINRELLLQEPSLAKEAPL